MLAERIKLLMGLLPQLDMGGSSSSRQSENMLGWTEVTAALVDAKNAKMAVNFIFSGFLKTLYE
jgi:hypothetical protein